MNKQDIAINDYAFLDLEKLWKAAVTVIIIKLLQTFRVEKRPLLDGALKISQLNVSKAAIRWDQL